MKTIKGTVVLFITKQQINYQFNYWIVLLKTLLIIYPKNDKQNIIIKKCTCSVK